MCRGQACAGVRHELLSYVPGSGMLRKGSSIILTVKRRKEGKSGDRGLENGEAYTFYFNRENGDISFSCNAEGAAKISVP